MIQAALHLAAAVLIAFARGDTSPLICVLAMLLALLPDIDTPRSIIGSLLRPISVPLERRLGHRTATHSLLATGMVASVAYLLAPQHWIVLAAAYGSHLVLDLLIGVQCIQLLWPAKESWSLTAWRDNGPAPRRVLLLLLPLVMLAMLWDVVGPIVLPPIEAAAAAANPIATPTPTKVPTPVPTTRPSIHLSFALPAGVGLSAVQVKAGDVLREGQILASWEQITPTPWPTPTAPPLPGAPAPPPTPFANAGANRSLVEAQAALAALTTAQSAERAALIAEQQRARADRQRVLADAQRTLGQLQPQHERDQQEAQHAVDAAHRELLDAQAAAALPVTSTASPEAVAAQAQRAAERVHAAEAALRSALDAQDQLRTDQGIGRANAEAKLAQAQADLDTLPEQQRLVLAKLNADHQAAQILAAARVRSAQSQVDAAAQSHEREAGQIAATATASTDIYHATATALAGAHQAAVSATARAIPIPALNSIVSHAAGRVVAVDAEEKDGRLAVTLEMIP